MWKNLVLAVAIVAITDASAFAAEAQTKNDLKRIADAMGATNLKSIQYSGSGFIFAVGQNVNPVAPWPRFDLKNLTRSINYETSSMRDDVVRLQPGGVEQRQVLLVSGAHAWNQPGNEAQPRLWEKSSREHQIWVTPPGGHQSGDGEQSHGENPDEGRPENDGHLVRGQGQDEGQRLRQ